MQWRSVYALALLLTAATSPQSLAAAPAPPVLPPHPRLILTPARIAELQALVSTDAAAASLFASLQLHAEWVLTQPPVAQQAPGPSGILIPIRTALDFALTSAATALLLGAEGAGAPFLERAVAELLSLSADDTSSAARPPTAPWRMRTPKMPPTVPVWRPQYQKPGLPNSSPSPAME